MNVYILAHVTYQLVANFVYFQKSGRTVCQKYTNGIEPALRQRI